MLLAGRVSRFAFLLVCLLVEFDLFLAFGVLACLILDCASLLCGLLSDKLRCLRLKSELLAFGILRKLIDVQLLRFSGSGVWSFTFLHRFWCAGWTAVLP